MMNSTSHQSLDELFAAELYLYFHEDFLSSERTQRECNFVLEKGQLSTNARILDLACGHGRHANQLAQMGYAVHGIDRDHRFIEIAKAEAVKLGLSTTYEEQDLLEMEQQNAFDAALLLFNTLGFFNPTDALRLLQKTQAALRPGGKLILDTKNRDHLLQELIPSTITERDQDLMIDRLSFDTKTGQTLNRRIYIKDGQRYDTPFAMTTYNFGDLKQMLQRTGFRILDTFGSWRGDAFDNHSRRIILVAEKL
ncbi:MAG: class I SAM-dependent methyltransferase [Bacteroidota bacterium]